MIQEGKTQTEIANTIDRDKSVINRELKRNKDERTGKYIYELAEKKAKQRVKDKQYYIRFTPDIKECP